MISQLKKRHHENDAIWIKCKLAKLDHSTNYRHNITYLTQTKEVTEKIQSSSNNSSLEYKFLETRSYVQGKWVSKLMS